MTKAHSIASLAAIGGFTAVIALQTGLPVAKADELADLRANQQLLQARIDQLAQAQQKTPEVGGVMGGGAAAATGAAAAPGTAAAGGSFPRSFLIPGTDTSIRVGGFVDFTALDFLNGGGAINGSNYSSNSGQNGQINTLPVGGGFVPGLGFTNPQATLHAPSRNNGILEFSPNQSRLDIETRTPTAFGEARTFFAFDFAGCDNYSCQTLAQGGGNSLVPRLRFAYGTLGGFLAGQALSNFSDADADTESMEFGGSIGSTGGQRIPQVRYTIPGPYDSAFSVSAENPWTTLFTPGGVESTDLNLSGIGTATTPPQQTITATTLCNGVLCTGTNETSQSGTSTTATTLANPTVAKAPNITAASYWAQPWGHVDFAVLGRFYQIQDGTYINQKFAGIGGHFAGDVHPGWFGYNKDDFLFSFVAGDAIGNYASGGLSTFGPLASNFTVTTACAQPIPGKCTGQFAASNILVSPVFAFSTNGGYQHWWTPNLRSTVAAGYAQQDVNSQLIGPTQATSVNKIEWSAFVNLVWNPVAFVTTGVQYMYGKRVVVANLYGHENVLIYKFRVAF
jgi:Porin subfamily